MAVAIRELRDVEAADLKHMEAQLLMVQPVESCTLIRNLPINRLVSTIADFGSAGGPAAPQRGASRTRKVLLTWEPPQSGPFAHLFHWMLNSKAHAVLYIPMQFQLMQDAGPPALLIEVYTALS